MDKKTIIALTIITIFEALIGIWVKLSGDNIPIYSLNFYRVFFAFLIVATILPIFSKIKFEREDLKNNIIIGILIALQISFFNIAMKFAPVANVVLFWSINPIFVFLYSSFFLKEKVKKSHIFIFIFGFIGLLISKPFSGSESNVTGNLIALTSSFIYATLIVFLRKEKIEGTSNVFWYMLFASIILLPNLFIFGFGNLFTAESVEISGYDLQAYPIFWALGLGAVSTGIVYILMKLTLSKVSASFYAIFDVVLSPVVAGILAYILLEEKPSENLIYGGAILLMSALWLNLTMVDKKKIPKLRR